MLKKSDITFSRLAAKFIWMFLLISVTVEADDQCGTQRLALYLSGVQQQEVNCISFYKNLCFLGLAARYLSEVFSTLWEENR